MLLPSIIKNQNIDIKLLMLDIGSRPTDKYKAPFHKLGAKFQASQILAVDADVAMCDAWNRTAPPGVRHLAAALGRTGETRTFYHYKKPEHSSLYLPHHHLNPRFHGLDGVEVRDAATVETVSLDRFSEEHGLGPVDFIKLDVQGAELEVMQGGTGVLRDVLALVSEVEFHPIYQDQPLFGDVAGFLRGCGLDYHKLLNSHHRALKPLLLRNSLEAGSQHVYSDAMFVMNQERMDRLPEERWLKAALLLDAYESVDWAYYLVSRYDARTGASLAEDYLTQIRAHWDPEALVI